MLAQDIILITCIYYNMRYAMAIYTEGNGVLVVRSFIKEKINKQLFNSGAEQTHTHTLICGAYTIH